LTSSVGDIKPAFRACTTVGFDKCPQILRSPTALADAGLNQRHPGS
jgi:hypothetical protein